MATFGPTGLGAAWGPLAAIGAALIAVHSFDAVVRQEELVVLAGMDDDVMLANVRRLYEASWAGLREAILPMPAQSSLGVYEPVALMFRLLVSHVYGGVSLRVMAIASLGLHAIVVVQSCIFTQILLRKLDRQNMTTIAGSCRKGTVSSDLKGDGLDAPTFDPSGQHAACALVAAVFFGAHPMRVEVGDLRKFEIVIFVVAAFSKAAVITLPAVLIMLDTVCTHPVCIHRCLSSSDDSGTSLRGSKSFDSFWHFAGTSIRILWWNAPFLVIALCAAIASAIAAGPVPLDVRALEWHESLSRSTFAVSFYAWRAIAPPWPWTTPRFAMLATISLMDPSFGLSMLLVTLSGCSLLTLSLLPSHSSRHGARLWLSMYVAYLLFLLPCSGLASGGHVWALAADRYSYAPSMCVLLPSLAILLNGLCNWIRCRHEHKGCSSFLIYSMVLVGVSIVLVAISAQSKKVASHWTGGSLRLFEAILDVVPNEFSTLKDIGSIHTKQGRLKAAVKTLHAATTLRPSNPGVLLNLATALHQDRRLGEAETWYNEAHQAASNAAANCASCVAEATELAKVEANTAALLLQARRAAEAVTILAAGWPWRDALPIARAPGFYHLGLAYASLGLREKAARAYRAAVSSSPGVGNGAALDALARLERPVDISGIR